MQMILIYANEVKLLHVGASQCAQTLSVIW